MTQKLLVAGASGQLGSLVIEHLKTLVPAANIVALVRSEDAAARYAADGIETRKGDYTDRASLDAAFQGIDRLLLISSSAVGERVAQHQNVIDAAKAAGVGFVAYTSILNADSSKMILAGEHQATEAMLAESGLPHALLRNGWYSENLLGGIGGDLAMGQHFGAAGEGKFSTATRQDLAEAAAVVLAGGDHAGKAYELAGDDAFTLAELAATIADASGKPVAYVDMPQDAFTQALVGAGLPEGFAAVLADSDAQAATGALYSTSKALSTLIGRPTTPIADSVKTALSTLA
jgi:NAD(P)H dehydrogenase (quinone)